MPKTYYYTQKLVEKYERGIQLITTLDFALSTRAERIKNPGSNYADKKRNNALYKYLRVYARLFNLNSPTVV
jgi:hypothetical protein